MATVALINPGLLVQRSDPFTTGIVYMPIGLAYVASALRAAGHHPVVIDAFGARPRAARRLGSRFVALGLSPDEVVDRIPRGAAAAFVYANQLVNHDAVVDVLRAIRLRAPHLPRVVLENTQAVTAYALRAVRGALFEAGATALLTGEAERSAPTLLERLAAEVDPSDVPGIDLPDGSPCPPRVADGDLDDLPPPAWDLFPLEGYWSLRFAHGPQTSARYLPLLTSRGCPYPCRFCVIPATTSRRWRARSPRSVVDEVERHVADHGVREFHIEDLNPTVRDDRTRALSRELIHRGVDVTWKLVAGTKVETIRCEETVDLMAAAGCRYVSVSPESGSARVLKAMNKSFDREHAGRVLRRMARVGIRTQACFVLGFPGEDAADREETRRMVHALARDGVDEVALFIVAPVPGAAIFDELAGYGSLSELSFSPSWRADYDELRRFRLRLYAEFVAIKARTHPARVARQALNFARRRFETKMEMVPYRALCWAALDLAAPWRPGG